MVRVRFCFFLLAAAAVLLAPAGAAAFQNEPDGFRGLSWGDRIGDMQGMSLHKKGKVGGVPLEVYSRDEDPMRYGEARLTKLLYGFYNDRLYMVSMVTRTPSDYRALKKEAFGRFGEPTAGLDNLDKYKWKGDRVTVILDYELLEERCVFVYYYQPIMRQIQEASSGR
jgi:hypothetical protein